MPIHEIYLDLKSRLNELRRAELNQQWLTALGAMLTGLSLLLLCAPFLAHWRMDSVLWRWLLAGVSFIAAACFLWQGFLRHVLNRISAAHAPSDVDLALRVGNLDAGVRDRFANALQVYSETSQENTSAVRRTLAGTALQQAYASVREISFERIIDRVTSRRRLTSGMISSAVCLLVWGVAPNYMTAGMLALLSPHRLLHAQASQLRVSPGHVEVAKGNDLRIQADFSPATDEAATLEWRLASNKSVTQIGMQRHAGASAAQFSHTLERVRENLSYRARVGKEASPWYEVTVLDPPAIQALRLTITYPRYTRRAKTALEENLGDVQALPGSSVSLLLRSNKDLARAELRFDSGATLPLRLDQHEATAEFPVVKTDTYAIHLVDKKGLSNPDPIRYRIELENDGLPVVRIVEPGRDLDLDESMLLPLTVEAEDDFGFSQLDIVYELMPSYGGETQTGRWPLPVVPAQSDKVRAQAAWDLSKIGMGPEDVVRYFAEVRDNDTVSGPKSARSEVYHARFPSITEIYEEVASQHEEAAHDLQSMREQAQKAKEKIDEVIQQLKKDPNLNWEQKQNLSESAGATEKIREELQSLQNKLEEMVSSMERNDMLSMKTLQKYMELQELLQKMDSPELQKALAELKKSMEKIDPQKLEEALKNFQFSQEEMLQSLERTMNLLKQIHAEQKLDEALHKAKDLLQRQQAINTEAAKKPAVDKRNELASEEMKMKEETQALEKALQDLSKTLKEMQQQTPAEKIEAAAQQMNSQDLAGEMQQMANQMQQAQMQQAQQTGQQIAQNLEQMSTGLQSAQQEMQQSQQRAIMQALQRGSSDLLQLSKQQEQLGMQSGNMNRGGNEFNNAADQQQQMLSGLQRVTEQLFNLSQKSFAVTPEIARALGQAMNNMQESMSQLEERNGPGAAQSQGRAMQGLDQAVAGLRQSMKQMGGAGGMSMGMDQFLQRLLGLSGKQQGINQESQQLGQQGLEGLRQQAGMARLAAEQAAVQKSLEQLLQEFGNRKEILGRLDQTANDMEEVVKDLQENRLGRQTLERQQQILSRMLDAQRSMRERDLSEERQAERSKNYRGTDPGALPENLGERRTKIQEDLLRALREKYSRDYRELIQKYFEALAREQQDTTNE
ncbi:MAG: DUF4175 family protein [bacterium]